MDECPMCLDGIDFDTQTICPVCYGLGIVTPGLICKCGRSAGYETPEGERFCGREACKKKAA